MNEFSRKHILLIDDDESIGNMEEELLQREGYQVSRAYSGTEALLLIEKVKPDLILLDLMLPGLSGEELMPRIKNIPVIVVSAKFDTKSKVAMLMDGAVDYITKPFDTKELLARIVVALRNSRGSEEGLFRFEELSLDTRQHIVRLEGREVKLTRTEYAILYVLMKNQTQVLTKNQILDHIAVNTPDCTENSLKQHISNLRKKLREAGGADYIEAVWGIGFRMQKS